MTARVIKTSWGRRFIDKDAVLLNFLFSFYRGWGNFVTYTLYASFSLSFVLIVWLVFGKTLTNSYVSDGTIFSCQVASERSMEALFKRLGVRFSPPNPQGGGRTAPQMSQSGTPNGK